MTLFELISTINIGHYAEGGRGRGEQERYKAEAGSYYDHKRMTTILLELPQISYDCCPVQRAAEREERERRKAEAAAAKRYPIEDMQLLAELRQAAAEAGGQKVFLLHCLR